ncbi:MAG TPA: DUF4870 domain-containing protein [Phycisphaerae bacterium]|nr:DUF4870 domain-containing protein [Phycisphaerae bacterium]HOJ73000.1 DUF4870 domain-containing protein [Phycisphaerae bacterium]HOM50184.1 DUF4870 domain-containing protein [Phycisphaerae bacterium]HON67049.1 DUF4870 domain-containing protein [Phycisphaerae bacterium]HOQ87287.1 DUF4870 domain-containing protein [Phycisphaerae bacterium]
MDQPPPGETEFPPQDYVQVPTTRDERTWAMLSHILPLPAVWLVGIGHILVPLINWWVKREESAFIEDQAKEALNFQISVTIYEIVAGLLAWFCVGFIVMGVVGVFWIVFAILAAMKANGGVAYRYPLIIRLVR